MNIWIWVLGGVGFSVLVLTTLFVLYIRSWTIPIVVFKLVGDKRRPVLDLSRRGKIVIENGVKKLKVRGTPINWEMKNFKNENYYLTLLGQPALVLFEFAKDCFTPMKPSLWQKLTGKEPGQSSETTELPFFTVADVKLDDDVLHGLYLKAIDDFDPDFIVRNFGRIDRQYTGGWRAFLKEAGWIIGWLLLFIMALVGIVMFFQKAPELANSCMSAAKEIGVEAARRAAAVAAAPVA